MSAPSRPPSGGDGLPRVLEYHERTKHDPNRFARSLGYMDWATQPDPFRTFTGTPRLALDLSPEVAEPTYDALFEEILPPPRPLDGAALGRLFRNSLALSAWKQAPGTNPWALRVNPSSGNLHPTEGYLIAGPVEGLSSGAGVYHYQPHGHVLERRRELAAADWAELAGRIPPGAFLVALTSIHWRESWKYGERAFRYCHHDVGHALAAVSLSAACLGWQARLLAGVSQEHLSLLLGVHGQRGEEAEHPDGIVALYPRSEGGDPTLGARPLLSESLLARLAAAAPTGRENVLSPSHHPWPIIDAVAAAVRFAGREGHVPASPGAPVGGDASSFHRDVRDRGLPAERIIRQRRSAVDMDGESWIEREDFYRMLLRASFRDGGLPFSILPWLPRVSLALFVHRVKDLAPGLYVLVRHSSHEAALRSALRGSFAWRRPDGCPEGLDLYLLEAADCRGAARLVSCHQGIAADGAFSLGMLARFEPTLREEGPWFYPRLFWETGVIGQVFYLEAEAAGVRGTGIGCFFDDAMHEILGIEDRSWQSLYHFTVGAPVEDPRIRGIDAYAHLEGGS